MSGDDGTTKGQGRILIVTAAITVLLAGAFAVPGAGEPVGAVAALLLTLLPASILPIVWVLASLGLGLAVVRSLPLALCIGVGVHLSIWHALGAVGLAGSLVASWAPVVAGVILLVVRRRDVTEGVRRAELRWPLVLASIGLALLLAASALPPGTVWASEANAYDSLSYHLQLPKEWHASGIIAPLAHNAYSHLPSYVEAAYAQLFAMRPGDPMAGTMPSLFSAHILHALFAVASALVLSSFVSSRFGSRAGAWAVPVMLSVPWVIVTGSLAYNEMAVALMAGGALVAVFDEDLRPLARGAIVGFLMGIAVSAKPTSMFTLAVPLGLAMACAHPPRRWVAIFGATGVVGSLTIAPWLIRNWIHARNPVFPFASQLFGTAHWTEEQALRWAQAHAGHGSAIDRIALLTDDRGFAHEQWGIFAPLVALALLACLFNPGTRRVALILGLVMLAQIAAWMSVGHQQSRFLLPVVVPGAAVIAMSADAMRTKLTPVLLALLTLTMAGLSTGIFLGQSFGRPNWALIPGVRVFTEAIGEDSSAMQPEAFVRTNLDPSARVLLVGEARALYFPGSVSGHTTWDRSPVGDAFDLADCDPDGALAALREMGYTHALINFDELQRLIGEGWYDPRVTLERAARLAEAGTTISTWAAGEQLGTRLVVLDSIGEQGGR